MDSELVDLISRLLPMLRAAAANALGQACWDAARGIAAGLFRGGQYGIQQRALARALGTAVAELIRETPALGDISFWEILRHEDVIAELLKVFDPNQSPDATRFRAALEGAGYDCTTLPRPPEDILKDLLDMLGQHARQDPHLQPFITVVAAERGLGIAQHTATQVAGLTQLVQGHIGRDREFDQVVAGLQADYAADLAHARTVLTASRFVEAREVLERIRIRRGFSRANTTTQAETLRLLGMADMHLCEYDKAGESFAEALALTPDDLKLRLNKAELDLRRGAIAEAKRAAEEVIAAEPNAWYAHRIVASADLDEGHTLQARERLESIPEKDDVATLSILARCDTAEGRYEDGIRHLDEALARAPDDPILLLQRVGIELQSVFSSPALRHGLARSVLETRHHELQAARATLERAVRSWDKHGLEPYSAEVRARLATVLVLLGEIEGAREMAAEATACLNAGAEAWSARVGCELHAGDLVAAESWARRALENQPGMPATVVLVAAIKAQRGQLAEAATDLADSQINGWPDEEKLHGLLMRARMLWSAGDHVGALSLVESLPVRLREHPRAVVERAEYLRGLDRTDEARSSLDEACSRYPQHPAILHAAGDADAQAGDYARARRRYFRAVRLAPNVRSLRGFALTCVRVGQARRALRLIDHFAQRGLSAEELIELRAMVLCTLGELEEAANAFDEYLAKQPDDAIALHSAAVCRFRLGHRDAALTLFERLADLRPNDWEICAALAQLHRAEGRREEAFRWAQEGLDRAGDEPRAHLLYVVIGFETGHGEEAHRVVEAMPAKFPDFPGLQRLSMPEALVVIRQTQERAAKIWQDYLDGKLPIALAAHGAGKPLALYRVALRETPAPFHADTGTLEDQASAARACQSNTQVVIDYPALLTLAQSGMLELPSQLFSRVYVASDTRQRILAERMSVAGRLDYLRTNGQREIRDELASRGVLERWKELAPDLAEWPLSRVAHDRHLCERADAWYLVDRGLIHDRAPGELPERVVTTDALVRDLWSRGAVTRLEYEGAVDHLRATNNWDDDNSSSPAEWPPAVVVERFTLSTLNRMELLDRVLDGIPQVLVSPLAAHELNGDVFEEDSHAEAARLIRDIEAALSRHEGVFGVRGLTRRGKDGEDPWRADSALASELRLPLWSDDLAVKAIYAGGTSGAPSFGSRTVLDIARGRNALSADDYHKHVVNLMHLGYRYCWFTGETLAWSLHQHNYQPNDDTGALLRNRGDPTSFERVAAAAIAEMACRHDSSGEPSIQQLTTWVRDLSRATAEGSAGVTRAFVAQTTSLLASRSWGVRCLWETLVANWASLGWIRRHRGRIEVPRHGDVELWRPDQGTSM